MNLDREIKAAKKKWRHEEEKKKQKYVLESARLTDSVEHKTRVIVSTIAVSKNQT